MTRLTLSIKYVLAVRNSRLLSELHEAFPKLGRLWLTTRFGFLSDKPDGILYRRAAQDAEDAGEEFDRDTESLIPRHDWLGGP
jgi:hypothetical protein